MWTSDENIEKYQLVDYHLIQYQILQTKTISSVWQIVGRITKEIMRVKGLNQAIFPWWYFHSFAVTFCSKTNEYCREKCILHHFRTWHSNFSYQQVRLWRSFLSKLFKLIFFFSISILLVKFNQHCFVFSNDLPQSKVGEEKKSLD